MADLSIERSDQDLAEQFARYAKIWGNAVIDGDVRKASQVVQKLGSIGRVFIVRSAEARLSLVPLLGDPEKGVRYYAARYLLALIPEKALAIMKDLTVGESPIAANARTTIRMLESGEYKPE